MQFSENPTPVASKRISWNKGKLTGAKPPLRPKHVWSIGTKLQMADRKRDLALFNLAIDSKLRGCDVVALKVEDIAPHGYALGQSGLLCPQGRACFFGYRGVVSAFADIAKWSFRGHRQMELLRQLMTRIGHRPAGQTKRMLSPERPVAAAVCWVI